MIECGNILKGVCCSIKPILESPSSKEIDSQGRVFC